MGNNTLNVAVDGNIAPAADINQFVDALKDNLLPRDTSTRAVTDLSGDLGTTLFRWGNAYIQKLIIGAIASGFSIEESGSSLIFKVNATDSLVLSPTQLLFKVGGVTKSVIDVDGVHGSYLKSLSVGTGSIANLAVTSAKLANLIITTDKLIDFSVTTGKIANFAVTREKQENPTFIKSASCGLFNSLSVTEEITNLSVSINTLVNRPVVLQCVGSTVDSGYFGTTDTMFIEMQRNGVLISKVALSGETGYNEVPASSIGCIDESPLAGLNTYRLVNAGGVGAQRANQVQLIAYSL